MPKDIEQPICAHCGVAMRWYNSALKRGTVDQIIHSFRCPRYKNYHDVVARHVVTAKRRNDLQETDAEVRQALLKLAAEYRKLSDRSPKTTDNDDGHTL